MDEGSGKNADGALLASPAIKQVSSLTTERQSLGFVRSIGWITLLILVVFSGILSSYFGSKARETLLKRQQRFSTTLGDHFNNQIYRRFTIPTMAWYGYIDLSIEKQYNGLDTIIQSIISGLQVEEFRIYGHNNTISYSTDTSELGQRRENPVIDQAARSISPIFETEDVSLWRAFFNIKQEKNSFILRTIYPLRLDNRMTSSQADGPVMGVLEFTQDITPDVQSAIRFQQLVLIAILSGSAVLFILLMVFLRRAERDVEARMLTEQLLINELHQNEKLAGMGRVVASIAHEIRNPLGIISSSAELLLKRPAATDPVTNRILQAIFDEARRLSRTVNDFLDYARPKQPQLGPVDVVQILSQAKIFLEPDLAQRDIDVDLEVHGGNPFKVRGDKDLLYRAFYNIMSNAIQAMDSKGSLRISLSPSLRGAKEMSLVFQDTGPGFSEEDLGQITDPFFTTKDGGTGLGLAIVNSILSSHGGTLSFSNAPEGGALVRVTLPVD